MVIQKAHRQLVPKSYAKLCVRSWFTLIVPNQLARLFRGNADAPVDLIGKEGLSIWSPIYSVNEKVKPASPAK
jgi:hypothetical protein